jgi:two-component system sensor histidine kinase/response regulator
MLTTDFSKMEANALHLEQTSVRLLPLVEGMVELTKSRSSTKKLTISLVFEPEILALPPVETDAMRLKQVLGNLLGNAVKFTPPQGRIDIHVSCKTRTENTAVVVFSFKDTGIGVDPDKQQYLFQAFSQLGGSQHGGTGLGLVICKRIVEALFGSIGMHSEGNGKGATFWFEVPLRVQGEAATMSPATPERRLTPSSDTSTPTGALRGRRILLADDNSTNLYVIKRMLSPTFTLVSNRARQLSP